MLTAFGTVSSPAASPMIQLSRQDKDAGHPETHLHQTKNQRQDQTAAAARHEAARRIPVAQRDEDRRRSSDRGEQNADEPKGVEKERGDEQASQHPWPHGQKKSDVVPESS